MARRTQLLQLVTMLRDEIGRADSVAVGVSDLPSLKQHLRRAQDSLYLEYDWPFLRRVFDRITLQAGQRYYDMPALLNVDRIEDVAVWWGNQPIPIERGIGFAEYAIHDSENDVRAEPAMRWDVRSSDTVEQIEIWPTPTTNSQQLQFIGIRNLRALIADSDRADLDDHMIVLYAAAELLGKDTELAKLKLNLGNARFNRLKNLSATGSRMYRMGMGDSVVSPRGRAIVRVSR